jgi:hypothetical protein
MVAVKRKNGYGWTGLKIGKNGLKCRSDLVLPTFFAANKKNRPELAKSG